MLATRRNLMAAVAVLPIAACPAPATATADGVSAKLAELINAARETMARSDNYYYEVEIPAHQRAEAAVAGIPHVTVPVNRPDETYWTTADPHAARLARSILAGHPNRGRGKREPLRRFLAADLRRKRRVERVRREVGLTAATAASNDYSDSNAAAEWDVARFPVASPADFHAKIAFMVERQMFDGLNHSEQMLADAARLAGVEA